MRITKFRGRTNTEMAGYFEATSDFPKFRLPLAWRLDFRFGHDAEHLSAKIPFNYNARTTATSNFPSR